MGQLYKDLNINMQPHPLTGDVGIVRGTAAIEQSLMNIVRTAQYERPFQPNLYGNIDALLFEPATQSTIQKIESNLQAVITNFEPRLEQVQVVVDRVEPDKYVISIYYRQRATTQTEQIQLYLNRNQ